MGIKEDIILVGGGGHCKACIDVIEQEGKFNIKGIIDKTKNNGQFILDYPIIGNDSDLEQIVKSYKNFLITIGFIKTPDIKVKLFTMIKEMGGNFPIIVSSKAYVSKHSHIEEGTIIMHGAIVIASARIGKNCIINNNSLIEHDATVGNHCHVSTGTIINGESAVGEKCFIGSNSVINQLVTVAPRTIVGSGSVIRKNIKKPGIYIGNPLRRLNSEKK